MKWLFVILLVIGLAIRDCGHESSNPPQKAQPQRIYVLPEGTIFPQQNKDLFDDFDGKFKLNWSILGIDNTHE